MSDAAPQGIPGDNLNWPMLKIDYLTDPDKLAALLPPGLSPTSSPEVRLTLYNFPVNNEPELGLVMNVAAAYDGVEGEYSLGYAIDQEQAVYISREHWGQPKYLASGPLLSPAQQSGGVRRAQRLHFLRVPGHGQPRRRGGRDHRSQRMVDQGVPLPGPCSPTNTIIRRRC